MKIFKSSIKLFIKLFIIIIKLISFSAQQLRSKFTKCTFVLFVAFLYQLLDLTVDYLRYEHYIDIDTIAMNGHQLPAITACVYQDETRYDGHLSNTTSFNKMVRCEYSKIEYKPCHLKSVLIR